MRGFRANDRPRIDERFEILDWIDSTHEQYDSVVRVRRRFFSRNRIEGWRRNDVRAAAEINAVPFRFRPLTIRCEMNRSRRNQVRTLDAREPNVFQRSPPMVKRVFRQRSERPDYSWGLGSDCGPRR